MLARVQLTLAAALLVVAVALGAVLLAGDDDGGTGRAADGVSVGPTGFAGAVTPDGITPRFTLRDQDGRQVALADFRGKVVVVAFLYTTCQDTCPTTAQQIRLALDKLNRTDDVTAIAVSVDPPPAGGDTPLNAKRFLSKQSLTGRMTYLLGTRAELQPVWAAYGIQPQGQGARPAGVDEAAFEHSAKIALVDGRGRLRVGFPVSELTPEALAHDIERLRSGA